MTYDMQAEIRAKHIRKLIVSAMRSGCRFDGGHNSRGYWLTATSAKRIYKQRPKVIIQEENFERMNYYLGFIRETRKRFPLNAEIERAA